MVNSAFIHKNYAIATNSEVGFDIRIQFFQVFAPNFGFVPELSFHCLQVFPSIWSSASSKQLKRLVSVYPILILLEYNLEILRKTAFCFLRNISSRYRDNHVFDRWKLDTISCDYFKGLKGYLYGEEKALLVGLALLRGLDFTSRFHGKSQPSYTGWLAYSSQPGWLDLFSYDWTRNPIFACKFSIYNPHIMKQNL